MVQIQLAMGDVEEQQHVIDAQNNIKDTWEELLALAKVEDRNAPLEWGKYKYNK